MKTRFFKFSSQDLENTTPGNSSGKSSKKYTVNSGKSAVLALLDLSAVFDTIDHVFISRLEHCVGIRENASKWFQSYFKGAMELNTKFTSA